jgi:hypothetical protein
LTGRFFFVALSLVALAACKKSEPDNAMTQYVHNLAEDQRRAQDAEVKANAAVAQEQKMMNQAAHQSSDQPQ